jgi:hypothetical protein
MVRRTPILIIASSVLLAGGVAAANNLLVGPSPGLTVGGGSVVVQSSTPSTTTTPSTVGPVTGTPTTTETTTGTATNGTATNDTVTTPPSGTLSIDRLVSVTRSVAAGTPVTAFTVPAGQQLVITDVLVTNPGTFPACGAAVRPAGTTPGVGEAGTGLLCVPAQLSLNLGLTTGLEFDGGQSVVLVNASGATEGVTTPGTTLHYHLRGFLMSSSGS